MRLSAVVALVSMGLTLSGCLGAAKPDPTQPASTPASLSVGSVLYSASGVDLWTASPDGTHRKRVTTDGATAGYLGARWSPDGAFIAAERTFPDESGTALVVVRTADASAWRISRKDTFLDGYSWSSDGRHLTYAELTSGGTLAAGGTLGGGVGDVHVYDVIARSDRILAPGNHPAFSPDGSHIAFDHPSGAIAVTALDGTPPVFLVNLAELSRLSGTRAPKGMGLLGAPQWSADGKSIAYSAIERGELLEALQIVYVQEAVPGAPPKQWALGKTGAIHHAAVLRWSPTSNRLAYSFIYAQPHHHYIGVIDPAKEEPNLLFDSAQHFLDFSWSPDGEVILLQNDDEDSWIYLDPHGGVLQRRSPGGWRPDWCRCAG
jgi:Tol biopolymer transport system component